MDEGYVESYVRESVRTLTFQPLIDVCYIQLIALTLVYKKKV